MLWAEAKWVNDVDMVVVLVVDFSGEDLGVLVRVLLRRVPIVS